MLFSTLTVLLASTLAAAAPAPALVDRDAPAPILSRDWLPNGSYIDGGYGTILHPGTVIELCLASDWETHTGSPLYIRKCISNQIWGTRFQLVKGGTLMRLMQARTNDYCITANSDRTGLEMTECIGTPQQSWNANGQRFKLTEENKCITVDGDLTGDGYGGVVSLSDCVEGAPNQNFTILGGLPDHL